MHKQQINTPPPRRRAWPRVAALLLGVLLWLPGSAAAHGGEPSTQTTIGSTRDTSCGAPDVTKELGGRTIEYEMCYQRTFDYDGSTKTITIYWTESGGLLLDRLAAVDSNGDGTADLTPAAQAEALADWTQEAWRTYRDYGFNDPLGGDSINVHLFDSDLLGWCCGGSSRHYDFDAPHLMASLTAGADPRDGRSVAFHEMWHASQYSWNRDSCFVNEGSASAMTDHVNVPVDVDDWNDYISRVGGYLAGGYRVSLLRHCYDGALWWKYFMERIGSTSSEPNVGMDAMQAFWETLNVGNDRVTVLPTLDAVTRGLSGGALDLTMLWTDFTVANYAKDLPGASLPAKYRYTDEQQSGGPDYPDLTFDLSINVTAAGGGPVGTPDVFPWAARYYRILPAADVPIINIDLRQDSANPLTYTLLKVRGGDIIEEERSTSRHFARSFANDSYDAIVVIVTAHAHFGNFRYSFNGSAPAFNIVDPVRGRAAMAGAAAAPGKILVKLELLSNVGATPVAGIDPLDFDLRVGGIAIADSDVVTSAYIQGQYWLLVNAPPQPGDGFFALEAAFGTLTSSQAEAVNYRTGDPADNVIIIDRSGSMLGDPLAAAQEAAKLYYDSYSTGDGIGVVAFNATAMPIAQLANWSNSTRRTTVFEAIDDLTATGGTTIGGGLTVGMQQMIDFGFSTVQWTMVLLSDGANTSTPTPDDFLATYIARRDAGDLVPRVHTIALGPTADRATMQRIATETGGNYFYAAAPSLRAPDNVAAYLELSELYRVVAESVTLDQQIYLAQGSAPYNSGDDHTLRIDSGATQATFVVKWPDNGFDPLGPTLRRPNGTLVGNCTLQTNGHCLWRVAAPAAGNWVVSVRPFGGSEFPQDNYMVEAAVKSDLTLNAYLLEPIARRIAGRVMPIVATLTLDAPVTGASVSLRVVPPTGGAFFVTLHDDGHHGDGAANDGIYGGTIINTRSAGSYRLEISASGSTPTTGSFNRRLRAAFDMLPAVDSDQDGIPDWYEEENGGNKGQNDSFSDWDLDGLTFLQEYQIGSDPRDPDSDDGGQSDGSEVTSNYSGDPLNPADDWIDCLWGFDVSARISTGDQLGAADGLRLQFHFDPAITHLKVWRADNTQTTPTVLFNQLAAVGEIFDNTVKVGNTPLYWAQGFNANGVGTCIVGPRSATYTGSVPPEGYVRINNGQYSTASPQVTLNLGAEQASEMQISNSPSFDNRAWQPYQPSLAWTLDANAGFATVYVQYRNATGETSEVVSDRILISNVPTSIGTRSMTDAGRPLLQQPLVLTLLVLLVALVALLRPRLRR